MVKQKYQNKNNKLAKLGLVARFGALLADVCSGRMPPAAKMASDIVEDIKGQPKWLTALTRTMAHKLLCKA